MYKQGATFLLGHHNVPSGMWQVKLVAKTYPHPPSASPESLNLMSDRTKTEVEQWYHITLFIPVNQIQLQAINKGPFDMCEYFKIYLMMKHLPPYMSTANIHMRQTSNNINSTNNQYPK